MKEVKLKCFSEKILFQARDIVIGFGCDWLSKKKGRLGYSPPISCSPISGILSCYNEVGCTLLVLGKV